MNIFLKFVIIKDKKEEFVVWYLYDGIVNLLVVGVFDVMCDFNVKYFFFDLYECVLLFIFFESFFFFEYVLFLIMYIMKDFIIKDNFVDWDDDGKWIYKIMNLCIVKFFSW